MNLLCFYHTNYIYNWTTITCTVHVVLGRLSSLLMLLEQVSYVNYTTTQLPLVHLYTPGTVSYLPVYIAHLQQHIISETIPLMHTLEHSTDVSSAVSFIYKSKGKFLYGAVSSPQDRSRRFTLYFPDRPVHSDTITASLGSIQPYAAINARRLLVHISTTVYSQVLI